jgi:hypothetical protein
VGRLDVVCSGMDLVRNLRKKKKKRKNISLTVSDCQGKKESPGASRSFFEFALA